MSEELCTITIMECDGKLFVSSCVPEAMDGTVASAITSAMVEFAVKELDRLLGPSETSHCQPLN